MASSVILTTTNRLRPSWCSSDELLLWLPRGSDSSYRKFDLAGRRGVRRRQDDRVVHCHHEPPLPDSLQQMCVDSLEGVDVDTVMLSGISEGDLPGQLELREAGDVGRKCERFFHAAYRG